MRALGLPVRTCWLQNNLRRDINDTECLTAQEVSGQLFVPLLDSLNGLRGFLQ